MINYIVQVVLCQVLFLAVYDFFLQKETFFKWNRLYLIATPIVSFIIPMLKFDFFRESIQQEYVVLLPRVLLNPQSAIINIENSVQTIDYISMLFIVGVILFSVVFLIKLAKILKIIFSHTIVKKSDYNLVLLEDKQSAFSFFNYIFIHKSFIEKEDLQVIEHELVHSYQMHTLDLLLFEILKIVMWFNPMIYIYQNRVKLLHEYISDEKVVKQTDKKSYFNRLLAETFNVENISFINQFYKHSFIKKRVMMITKEKSKRSKQLKYLLFIPVLLSMLFYVSCTDDVQVTIDTIQLNSSNKEVITEGKYFRPENGQILFMGKSLKGEVVSFENYTDKEKELYQKMLGIHDYSQRMLQIIINEEGERVVFMKPPLVSSSSKKDYSNSEDVPFAIIDEVPVFPGCTGSKEELKSCLNRSMQKHVKDNFNSKLGDNIGLSGKQKIYVQFKITKTGTIEVLGARAPHKELENEARRVINSLPTMTPGKHNGKEVNVTYMLPIAFDVQ
jgi:bla regulator protein BlaR1